MFGRKKNDPIDARAMLDARDQQEMLEGARLGADLPGKSMAQPGGRRFLLLAGTAVVVVAGLVTAQAFNRQQAVEGQPTGQVVRNLKPDYRPADVDDVQAEAELPVGEGLIDPSDFAPPASASLASAPQPGPVGGPTVPALEGGYTHAAAPQAAPAPPPPTPAEIAHARRLSADFGARPRQTSGGASQAQQAASGGEGEGAIVQALRPVRLSAQAAGRITNRDYMLTQGAMLDCVLETRIVSTVPGMTSCHLTRDVYSTNGRVVVLDRGSKVVGQYQGGIRQGAARVFVQWIRVETPKGVIINLDSPGTGPLGEGGLGGYVDNHFRERFGGAILLSLLDDAGDYFANQRGSAGNSIQLGNTGTAAQEMARTALESSVNIPPTLYKNQGERIAIFVARDLSFEGVYDLVHR